MASYKDPLKVPNTFFDRPSSEARAVQSYYINMYLVELEICFKNTYINYVCKFQI